VVQFKHTCEAVHSTVQYGTVTRAVICDSARAGLGPKLSHICVRSVTKDFPVSQVCATTS